MQKKIILWVLALVAFSGSAFATSTFMWSEGVLSLAAPLWGNLYAGGQSVLVSQPVAGDVLAAGNDLTINAAVEDDVWGGASNITVNAPIGWDMRVAAGNVFVNQSVAWDLIVAAGNVTVASGVTIGGDLLVAAWNLDMQGKIAGNAKLWVATLNLFGSINGHLDTSFEKITVTSGASVGWVIQYKAPSKSEALEALSVDGNVKYTTIKSSDELSSKGTKILTELVTGIVLYKWVVFALFAILLLLVWRNFFAWVANVLIQKPGKSFLTGLLMYMVTPLVILFLIVTVVGLPIAGIIGLLYIVLLLLSWLASSAIIAWWFIQRFWGGLEKASRWKIVLVAIVVAFLFAVIAGIDWIAVFFAMGAASLFKYAISKKALASLWDDNS